MQRLLDTTDAVCANHATMPSSIFRALIARPLTDKGLAQLEADWAAGQTIL